MALNKQLLKKIIKISYRVFFLKVLLVIIVYLRLAIAWIFMGIIYNEPEGRLLYSEYEIDMPINKVCENMEKIADSKPYLVTYENNAEKVIETHDIIQSKSEKSAYCYIYIKCIDNYIGFRLIEHNNKTLVDMDDNLSTGLFDIYSSQYFIVTEILSEIGSWHSRFMNLSTFLVYLPLIIVPIFILLVIETIVIVACGGILFYKKIRNNKA